jgi:hypothetical protein
LAFASPFTGPVSNYYLDNGNSIFVVQGTNVTSFQTAYGRGISEGALAVSNGTIRTRADEFDPQGLAGEYKIDGTPTGVAYLTDGSRVYDGTSDGLSNYFVDHFFGVFRTDLLWQKSEFDFCPTAIVDTFSDPCHGLSGVGFDPIDHTLWFSSNPTQMIAEYTLGGALLRSFPTDTQVTSLGIDPADHTIWVMERDSNVLRQYSVGGMLLQSGTVPGIDFHMDSGDFEVITPEPSTLVLSVPVLAALVWRLRSRR